MALARAMKSDADAFVNCMFSPWLERGALDGNAPGGLQRVARWVVLAVEPIHGNELAQHRNHLNRLSTRASTEARARGIRLAVCGPSSSIGAEW